MVLLIHDSLLIPSYFPRCHPLSPPRTPHVTPPTPVGPSTPPAAPTSPQYTLNPRSAVGRDPRRPPMPEFPAPACVASAPRAFRISAASIPHAPNKPAKALAKARSRHHSASSMAECSSLSAFESVHRECTSRLSRVATAETVPLDGRERATLSAIKKRTQRPRWIPSAVESVILPSTAERNPLGHRGVYPRWLRGTPSAIESVLSVAEGRGVLPRPPGVYSQRPGRFLPAADPQTLVGFGGLTPKPTGGWLFF
ncbi:hypothetical protein PGTUg99_015277 [Puccinia graminis f. sp. tritici]|uniref:Uncharacterized protein n=1 Tax=Puccinia graminis f. sp. tritici TaxID=56615 RepID=A0A5B0RJM1_PUCGR|nr:hypothetical protein PGTUg99_015277 [Puccinia graminis f. sp. tritici]